MHHLVSEKVVITAFKMHKKVAVGSLTIGWVLSYYNFRQLLIVALS